MSIGEELEQARQQASLTVAQVSQQTRIREAIIRDIEGDDYSACGGDFYARGHIRSIARVVGADPESLISQYDATQPEPEAITDAEVTQPIPPVVISERRRLSRTAVLALGLALGLALLAGIGFVAYHIFAGSPRATSAATAARAHPVTRPPATHISLAPTAAPTPTPKTTAPAAVPTRVLAPARAAAFGLAGTGQGDNNDRARLAIDGSPATAWRTDWYTTPHFGNLYRGTGLLVDMGRPVTITAAQIALGPAHGGGFQLRVGPRPSLADLRPVARADAAGVVRLRLRRPAHGRYVLIWFTSLPLDPAGTYQASVHNLRLEGR